MMMRGVGGGEGHQGRTWGETGRSTRLRTRRGEKAKRKTAHARTYTRWLALRDKIRGQEWPGDRERGRSSRGCGPAQTGIHDAGGWNHYGAPRARRWPWHHPGAVPLWGRAGPPLARLHAAPQRLVAPAVVRCLGCPGRWAPTVTGATTVDSHSGLLRPLEWPTGRVLEAHPRHHLAAPPVI